jgi:hypothetical protein
MVKLKQAEIDYGRRREQLRAMRSGSPSIFVESVVTRSSVTSVPKAHSPLEQAEQQGVAGGCRRQGRRLNFSDSEKEKHPEPVYVVWSLPIRHVDLLRL